MRDESDREHEFGRTIGRVGPQILAGLDALEQAFRMLHPPDFPSLGARLAPVARAVEEADLALAAVETPSSMDAFRADLREVLGLVRRALAAFAPGTEPGIDTDADADADPRAAPRGATESGIARVFGAMHDFAHAQAKLYPLHPALPAVSEHFLEPFRRASPPPSAPPRSTSARVGLLRAGEPGARGGFDLYVPEHYDGAQAWPLVVALHGGSGSGRDFLWSWLREARSRDCLLVAPTSRGRTWSLHAPALDGDALFRLVERIAGEWRVDRSRVLLTGLSDGGTMTLLVGAAADSPFTHLAPIAGVLHPMNFANGNLGRLRGRPVWLVHGRLDWMFPVALAREAARILEQAGAALAYRELADLSHAYPREENASIIEWLDPRRAARALAPPR